MLSWMQDLFSNQPPVYARPPPGSTPVTPNSPSYRSESPANPPPRPNPPNQPRMPDVNSAGNVNESGMPPVIPARPRQLVMPGTSSYGGPSHGSGSQEVGLEQLIDSTSCLTWILFTVSSCVQARPSTTQPPCISLKSFLDTKLWVTSTWIKLNTPAATRPTDHRRETCLWLRPHV